MRLKLAFVWKFWFGWWKMLPGKGAPILEWSLRWLGLNSLYLQFRRAFSWHSQILFDICTWEWGVKNKLFIQRSSYRYFFGIRLLGLLYEGIFPLIDGGLIFDETLGWVLIEFGPHCTWLQAALGVRLFNLRAEILPFVAWALQDGLLACWRPHDLRPCGLWEELGSF